MNNPYQVKGRGFGITGSNVGNQFLSDFQTMTEPVRGAFSSWMDKLTPDNSTNTLGMSTGPANSSWSAQDWANASIPQTASQPVQSIQPVQSVQTVQPSPNFSVMGTQYARGTSSIPQGYGLTAQDAANYRALAANGAIAGVNGADWTTAPLVYNTEIGANNVLPSAEGGIGVVPADGSSYGWDSFKSDVGDVTDGINGFVNDTLGGWGNVFQGVQALGNLYGGFKQLGMMQDQLDLARDSFNFNKALTSQNLANQVKSYNTSLADRYRARAFTETGNANAYDKQIEERKLDSKI